jgi:uncharacterized protein YgiM (DUF1202 family)
MLRMKKHCLIGFAVLAASLTTVDVRSADAATICKLPGNAARLSMRKCPSFKCKVIGTYRKGTNVDALGFVNYWIRVRVKGKTGYMADKYLCGDDIDFG